MKGRMTAYGAVQGSRAYLGLLAFQAVLWDVAGVTVPYLVAATRLLIAMTFITIGVVAAWNVCSWAAGALGRLREAREADRIGGLLAAFPGPYGLVVMGTDEHGRPVHAVPSPYSWEAALQRAVTDGKLSVNGYRYMGPPPVVTETVYEVAYSGHGVAHLVKRTRVTEGRMLPSGAPGLLYSCEACKARTVECSLDHSHWMTPGHAHVCKECVRR